MKDRVNFAPNIPQTVSLEFPEGRKLETGNVMYSLVGGRVMFLAPDVSQKIQQLGVKPGEPFSICKRWNGQRARASVTRWDVWLTPKAEQERAKEEAGADLIPVLQRSLDAQALRKPQVVTMPTPAFPLAPTGTDGPNPMPLPGEPSLPVPIPVPVPISRKPPQVGKIPFNVAFQETVKIVKEGLEGAGEQWNDEARQGMVSTILIAAANQGWLAVWERGEAA